MPIDISRLSELELVELNRRIVERLRLIRSARQLTALARFSVGMTVEFAADDGRLIRGTIARLNRQTATVCGPSGHWRVSPSLLRVVDDQDVSAPSARVVPMTSVARRPE
jgi:hypothetical protein